MARSDSGYDLLLIEPGLQKEILKAKLTVLENKLNAVLDKIDSSLDGARDKKPSVDKGTTISMVN